MKEASACLHVCGTLNAHLRSLDFHQSVGMAVNLRAGAEPGLYFLAKGLSDALLAVVPL